MITQKLKKYDFSDVKFSFPAPFPDIENGFLLKINLSALDFAECQATLFELPGRMSVSLKRLCKSDEPKLSTYEKNENYFYGADLPFVTVLEATLFFTDVYRPEWHEMHLGIPVNESDAQSEIVLGWNGTWLRFIKNGVVVNENYPSGALSKQTSEMIVDKIAEGRFAFSTELSRVKTSTIERKVDCGVNYYTPYGRNSFAGDAVCCYINGVYHLMYLYDRHHHGNRWYGGAHFFCQLTTTDFVNWCDEGPLFEFEYPWQSGGTGTMFYRDGKYYLAFGLHTNRNVPRELTQGAYMKDNYPSLPVETKTYDEIFALGRFPSGSNLAVSDDGIHFKDLHTEFHWEVNPSVYCQKDGSFSLYGGSGVWHAPDVLGPWEQVSSDFPPHGAPPMYNSIECPSFFEKNGYKYLIIGVTGFYRTEKDGDEYFDSAAIGYDVYDGLVVPMACVCGERIMYAGWLSGFGWASCLVQRELIQYPDGRLGMRWLPENAPSRTLLEEAPSREIALKPGQSTYFELEIDPESGTGAAALQFESEDGGCELKLDFANRTAQYASIAAPGLQAPIPPMHEAIPMYRQTKTGALLEPKNLPNRSFDFSIANVDVMQAPFTLKVLLHISEKLGSAIIDAEINGSRTLITNRVGFAPLKAAVLTQGDAKVTRFCVCDAENECFAE